MPSRGHRSSRSDPVWSSPEIFLTWLIIFFVCQLFWRDQAIGMLVDLWRWWSWRSSSSWFWWCLPLCCGSCGEFPQGWRRWRVLWRSLTKTLIAWVTRSGEPFHHLHPNPFVGHFRPNSQRTSAPNDLSQRPRHSHEYFERKRSTRRGSISAGMEAHCMVERNVIT